MFKDILLPLDLGQERVAKELLERAVKISQQNNAHLHIMTVVPDYGMAIVGSFFPAGHEKNAIAKVGYFRK